ncbi:non-ribosomal peptide synthetase [Actinoplanes oblitus]|uniref:Non-ribosomal peptide synthetase n=1 Tax=Actinoplanes oblitus TaxID=3040509 RepID=A0ABY8WA82_9ACTN|nr:non-ribosomal peptide synthetase [Actinoplanes oblitus]WIM94417.1 non-ribosomal peptide synthetase [Actinoplanes oblitus]
MSILHGPVTSFPDDATITAAFAEQVRDRPDALAVVDGGHSLTYRELDERADRLATLLRRRGAGAESRVGIVLERGHEMITAILATLKAGAAYVPISVAYPADRQRTIAAEAEVSVLVTPELIEQAADPALTVERLAPPAGSRALAYVLFTSGSTGRPKGVMVEHRSVLRLVRDPDYISLGPDERIAQVANPSFDAFTFEIWGALLNGGTLCVIPTAAVLSPGAFKRALARHRVTTTVLATALFAEIMADQPDTFAGLRNVLVGGDVLNVAHARRLVEDPRHRPGRLLNVYGPTETTAWATYAVVETVPAGATSIPIGGPIANTSCYVLDADRKPVQPGETGELFVGGTGVARGYAGQPEQTRERFLPDPFGTRDDALMYRTGDLVRTGPDGLLQFLGRIDDQVKIRGYRVEPGEVEAALSAHSQVRQVAVVAERAEGDRRLVAHVVPASPELTATELRQFLAGRLPEWMVPALFVFSERLALSAHGKIDKSRLPETPADLAEETAVPPRTELEESLAAITAEMLGLTSVGVTDDFFALGGHSLLAMRLLSRVNDQFDTYVALGTFLYEPTVERLAAEVSGGR